MLATPCRLQRSLRFLSCHCPKPRGMVATSNSGRYVQFAGESFKRGYVAEDNFSRAVEAVVIPAPPVADLESLAPTLDPVPRIALAVVSALGHVHLGSDAKGFSTRHRRSPVLRARRYRRSPARSAPARPGVNSWRSRDCRPTAAFTRLSMAALRDDKIGPAKALPVEVMALRVDAALAENSSSLCAYAHVEAAAHSLALPDTGHGHRLQLLVGLLYDV